MRIYIAAPLSAHLVADELASALHARGHVVVSGWHAIRGNGDPGQPPPTDPLGEDERAAILRDNLADLAKAQGLIALTHFHDVVGRGTYGEIGYALARGLPVAWMQDGWQGRSIFDAHPLVQRFQRMEWEERGEVLADWARTYDAPDDERVAVLNTLGKVVGYVRKCAERGRLRPVAADVVGGQGGAGQGGAADEGGEA